MMGISSLLSRAAKRAPSVSTSAFFAHALSIIEIVVRLSLLSSSAPAVHCWVFYWVKAVGKAFRNPITIFVLQRQQQVIPKIHHYTKAATRPIKMWQISVRAKNQHQHSLVFLLLALFQFQFVRGSVQDRQRKCLTGFSVLQKWLSFSLTFSVFFSSENFFLIFFLCGLLVIKAKYKNASCMYVIVYFVYVFKFVSFLISPKVLPLSPCVSPEWLHFVPRWLN